MAKLKAIAFSRLTAIEIVIELLNRVAPQANGCWFWLGVPQSTGYGSIKINGMTKQAHRIVYQYLKEDPKDKLVLHKCDTPRCVNPEHLWLGSHKDNSDDKIKKGRDKGFKKKTICTNGHLFTPGNTTIRKTGNKTCKECNRTRARLFARKKRLGTNPCLTSRTFPRQC